MDTQNIIMKKMKKYHKKEKLRSSIIHVDATKIPACRFCGSTKQGERISSCKKRSHLKTFSVEYTLGR